MLFGVMDKDNDVKEERHGIVSKGTQSSQYIGSATALGRAEFQSLYNNPSPVYEEDQGVEADAAAINEHVRIGERLVALHQGGVERALYGRCHPC
jgi:hypothetical protein